MHTRARRSVSTAQRAGQTAKCPMNMHSGPPKRGIWSRTPGRLARAPQQTEGIGRLIGDQGIQWGSAPSVDRIVSPVPSTLIVQIPAEMAADCEPTRPKTMADPLRSEEHTSE